jgi:hypothetical protein
MRWPVLWLLGCTIVSHAGGLYAATSNEYVIVSLVPEDDPYFKAATELKKLRGGQVLMATADRLEMLPELLRPLRPQHVAIVLRPESLDENLVRKLIVLATHIDQDPFVDFAYGFITGDSADAAVALAQAGNRAESRVRQPAIAMLGVAEGGLATSTSSQQQIPLRSGLLPFNVHMIAGGSAGNKSDNDSANKAEGDPYVREVVPKLADSPIVLFAGHGYPSRVVGGPTYHDLAGQRFDGNVVLNIACYTGVTNRWFDNDWGARQVREKCVAPDRSFCLNMLNTGVAAYVAYVSARPAGPAMLGDAVTIATEGHSIGELMRRNANSIVLAHLQQSHDQLQITELTDGKPITNDRTVRDTLIEMSTGAALFGDPAFVPFKKQPGAHPVRLTGKRRGDRLTVKVDVSGPLFHFFCSDQVAMWDDKNQSLRFEAIVPLGARNFADVRLVKSSLGDAPHRVTAAVEEHRGKRSLHVKASFEQPDAAQLMQVAQNGLSCKFAIETSDEPHPTGILRHEETR